ncbi:MAG: hypothetical protein ACT4NY_16480 [Pseudonocardiales bacterium]
MAVSASVLSTVIWYGPTVALDSLVIVTEATGLSDAVQTTVVSVAFSTPTSGLDPQKNDASPFMVTVRSGEREFAAPSGRGCPRHGLTERFTPSVWRVGRE